MVKAAGLAAGTLCVAIGLSAQLGGADLFSRPARGHDAGQAGPPALTQPPPASPSAKPSEVEAMTAAGTIYAGWQGGGKKKHGKG